MVLDQPSRYCQDSAHIKPSKHSIQAGTWVRAARLGFHSSSFGYALAGLLPVYSAFFHSHKPRGAQPLLVPHRCYLQRPVEAPLSCLSPPCAFLSPLISQLLFVFWVSIKLSLSPKQHPCSPKGSWQRLLRSFLFTAAQLIPSTLANKSWVNHHVL